MIIAHARRLGPRARSRARSWLPSSQPSRIFTVTGTVDRADHRLDQPQRQVGVAHQRRAGEPVRHLLGRAAEVDVDDPRALPRARSAPPRPSSRGSRPASCTAVRPSSSPSSARARADGFAVHAPRRSRPSPTPRAPRRSAAARSRNGHVGNARPSVPEKQADPDRCAPDPTDMCPIRKQRCYPVYRRRSRAASAAAWIRAGRGIVARPALAPYMAGGQAGRADADGGLDRRGRARQRLGGATPKQYLALGGRPVLRRAVAALLAHPGDRPGAGRDPPRRPRPLRRRARRHRRPAPAPAGRRRRRPAPARCCAGLEALAAEAPDRVLIHDAARPFLPAAADRRRDRGARRGAGAPSRPCRSSTRSGAATGGRAPATGAARRPLARADAAGLPLRRRSSPRTAPTAARPLDDVAVARAAGLAVAPRRRATRRNFKITTAADLARARALIGEAMDIRTGNGFDVHAFGPGDGVTLCGVAIPFDRGLVGHSDADVGLHALTDAIFGALAEGDIGQWFPPSDPAWKGAASEIFLRKAVERAAAPRLRHHPPRLHAGLRGAEDRPARRGDARGRRRGSPASRPTGSASRRPPPSASASPAAARASPRSPPPRWCGRDAALIATFGYVGLMPVAAGTWGSLAALAAGYLLHRLGGFPLLAARDRRRLRARLLGDAGRDLRDGRSRPRAYRHRRGRRPVDRADAALARPLARRRAAARSSPGRAGSRPSCSSASSTSGSPGRSGWADRRKGPTGVMLDDVIAGPDGRARRDRCWPALAHGWLRMIAEALARALIDAARARGWKIATAESCTGGLVSAAITDIAGSSDVFDRGFVTYSYPAKVAMLGVPQALLTAHGAVSEPVARAMAEGALAASDADARRRGHRRRRPGRVGGEARGAGLVRHRHRRRHPRRAPRLRRASAAPRVRARSVETALELALQALARGRRRAPRRASRRRARCAASPRGTPGRSASAGSPSGTRSRRRSRPRSAVRRAATKRQWFCR